MATGRPAGLAASSGLAQDAVASGALPPPGQPPSEGSSAQQDEDVSFDVLTAVAGVLGVVGVACLGAVAYLNWQKALRTPGRVSKGGREWKLAPPDDPHAIDWLDAMPTKLWEDIELFEQIGAGLTARVVAGRLRDGRDVALKVISMEHLNTKTAELTRQEATVLQRVNHPNIVNLVLACEVENWLFLVLERCRGGELFESIVSKHHYSENTARVVAVRIAHALVYLHSIGIMHRDLKPENILLVQQGDDTDVKLCDFGLAKIFSRDIVLSRRSNSPDGAIAPEGLQPGQWPEEPSSAMAAAVSRPSILSLRECDPVLVRRMDEGGIIASSTSLRLVPAGIVRQSKGVKIPGLPVHPAAATVRMDRSDSVSSLESLEMSLLSRPVVVPHAITMLVPPPVSPPPQVRKWVKAATGRLGRLPELPPPLQLAAPPPTAAAPADDWEESDTSDRESGTSLSPPSRTLQKARTVCGTPRYLAPEVLMAEPYSYKADWFSFGVFLHALLTGEFPPEVVFGSRSAPPLRSRAWRDVSDSARKVVQQLLHPSPTKRADGAAFFNSDWVKSLSQPTAPLLAARGSLASLGSSDQAPPPESTGSTPNR
jgi:serine/threonine protein kinase